MTLDKYCMECGESQDMNAKKCDYCGCKELDTMDIDDIA
jgi:ribosomal protein L40E